MSIKVRIDEKPQSPISKRPATTTTAAMSSSGSESESDDVVMLTPNKPKVFMEIGDSPSPSGPGGDADLDELEAALFRKTSKAEAADAGAPGVVPIGGKESSASKVGGVSETHLYFLISLFNVSSFFRWCVFLSLSNLNFTFQFPLPTFPCSLSIVILTCHFSRFLVSFLTFTFHCFHLHVFTNTFTSSFTLTCSLQL